MSADATSRNIAVAGPGGTLGPYIIPHLVKAGFHVTVLTRDPEKAAGDLPDGVEATRADYTSPETLTPTLRTGNFGVLIILINRNQHEAQITAIDAAIAAGIPHIVPSSFAMGTAHEELRNLPPLAGKIQMEDHLFAKAAEGRVTYTSINTGIFLDWALSHNMLVHLDRGSPSMIFDKGDTPISGTKRDDIATAVVNALLKREETKNQVLAIQSAVFTQQQLLGYARAAAPDREFPEVRIDTDLLEKEAWEEYNAGSRSVTTMRKFLVKASSSKGLVRHKGDLANELLGVHELSEEELKAEVVKHLPPADAAPTVSWTKQ